jgi:hypothetical protein
MPGTGIALSCPNCGGNRFGFPRTDEEQVTCEECGSEVQSLGFVKALVGGALHRAPKPASNADKIAKRQERHASEIEMSQAALRASVAETDRLISESDKMLRRHRREIEEDL